MTLRLLDEPVVQDAGGFANEFFLTYVDDGHGGPCAMRYYDRKGGHWAIFPTYRAASAAAGSASRTDIGGYTDVAIYPLSAAAIDTPRFDTSTDWLFGDDGAPEPERERGVHYQARIAMREMIRIIARRPAELVEMKWFDLERALCEAFDGLGYHVRQTRSTKDGGYDLDVAIGGKRYLVEIKHWNDTKKVGPDVVERFGEVVLRERAEAGLVLSSGGFSGPVASARIDVSRGMVMLGDSRKVLSLCRSFVLSEGGIWQRSGDLEEVFFADTF